MEQSVFFDSFQSKFFLIVKHLIFKILLNFQTKLFLSCITIQLCYCSLLEEFSHACVCKGAQCERRAITDDDGCTRFEEMVVYGIGSLAGSVISRYQFALALLLARKYRVCFIFIHFVLPGIIK